MKRWKFDEESDEKASEIKIRQRLDSLKKPARSPERKEEGGKGVNNSSISRRASETGKRNEEKDSMDDKKRINDWFMKTCAEKLNESSIVRHFTGKSKELLCIAYLRALNGKASSAPIEYFGVYSGPDSHFPCAVIVGTKDKFFRITDSVPFYAWKAEQRDFVMDASYKELCCDLTSQARLIANWMSALQILPMEVPDRFEPIEENSGHVALFVACGGINGVNKSIKSYCGVKFSNKDMKERTIMVITQDDTHYCALLHTGSCYFGPLARRKRG